VAEGAPLLREYVGKTCIEGSNPSDSASNTVKTGPRGPFLLCAAPWPRPRGARRSLGIILHFQRFVHDLLRVTGRGSAARTVHRAAGPRGPGARQRGRGSLSPNGAAINSGAEAHGVRTERRRRLGPDGLGRSQEGFPIHRCGFALESEAGRSDRCPMRRKKRRGIGRCPSLCFWIIEPCGPRREMMPANHTHREPDRCKRPGSPKDRDLPHPLLSQLREEHLAAAEGIGRLH
jgi:hypothetical protein